MRRQLEDGKDSFRRKIYESFENNTKIGHDLDSLLHWGAATDGFYSRATIKSRPVVMQGSENELRPPSQWLLGQRWIAHLRNFLRVIWIICQLYCTTRITAFLILKIVYLCTYIVIHLSSTTTTTTTTTQTRPWCWRPLKIHSDYICHYDHNSIYVLQLNCRECWSYFPLEFEDEGNLNSRTTNKSNWYNFHPSITMVFEGWMKP